MARDYFDEFKSMFKKKKVVKKQQPSSVSVKKSIQQAQERGQKQTQQTNVKAQQSYENTRTSSVSGRSAASSRHVQDQRTPSQAYRDRVNQKSYGTTQPTRRASSPTSSNANRTRNTPATAAEMRRQNLGSTLEKNKDPLGINKSKTPATAKEMMENRQGTSTSNTIKAKNAAEWEQVKNKSKEEQQKWFTQKAQEAQKRHNGKVDKGTDNLATSAALSAFHGGKGAVHSLYGALTRSSNQYEFETQRDKALASLRGEDVNQVEKAARDKALKRKDLKLAGIREKTKIEQQKVEELKEKEAAKDKGPIPLRKMAVGAASYTGQRVVDTVLLGPYSLASMGARVLEDERNAGQEKNEKLKKQLAESGQFTQEELDEEFKRIDRRSVANAYASSGIEILSELMFSGIGLSKKYMPEGTRGILDKTAGKLFGNIGKTVAGKLGLGISEETAEEWISNPVQARISNMLTGNRLQFLQEESVRREYQKQAMDLKEMQATSADINSDAFLERAKEIYKESGATDEEASKIAELARDYFNADIIGDSDTAEAKLSEITNILAGGENDLREKWTLKDALEVAGEMILSVGAEGFAGAVSSSAAGNDYKANYGIEGVRKLAKVVENLDADKSDRAKAIIDDIDKGKDVTGTQVSDLMQWSNEAALKAQDREIARDDLVQKRMKSEKLYVPIVDSEYNLAPATEERFEAITDRVVDNIQDVMKLNMSDVDAYAIGDVVAAFETGTISAEQMNELNIENPEARTVFEKETGIDLGQYTVKDKSGNIRVAESNVKMQKALFSMAADNYMESARIEQENWNDTARGQAAEELAANMDGMGSIGVQRVLESVDPRNRGDFILAGSIARRVYEHARLTNDSWDEVKKDFKNAFPNTSMDESMRYVYDMAKRSKDIAETKYYGQQVSDKHILKDADPMYVPGEFTNRSKRVPKNSELSTLTNLATTLGVNIVMEDLGNDNGSYSPSTRTIRINSNKTMGENLQVVLSHEVTHHLAAYAPDEYLKLSRFIMDKAYKADADKFTASIKSIQKLYKERKNQDLSPEEALEEIIANNAHEFWQDENFIDDVTREEPSLAQAIINSIKDILRKIRSVLSSGNVTDENDRQFLFDEINAYDAAYKMWTNAFRVAKADQANQAINDWQDDVNAQSGSTERLSLSESVYERADKAMPNSILREGQAVNNGENEEGRLVEMFHGSGVPNFTEFDLQGGMLGDGAYFTSAFPEAVDYAKEKLGITETDDGKWLWDGEEYYNDELEDALEEGGYVRPFYLNVTDENDVSPSKYGNGNVIAVIRNKGQAKSSDAITIDDNGDVVPIEQRFDESNPDIRYSISEQQDADYMKAVESGDMETAQRMVDEAAAKAMPNTATPGRWLHGTENDFTVFDFSQGGKNGAAEGFGIYLARDKDVSEHYGKRLIEGYANIEHPATDTERTLSKSDLVKLISATVDQEAERLAEDYDGDIEAAKRDTWISNYTYTYDKSLDASIGEVADSILDMNEYDREIVQEVMAGMAIRDYSEAEKFYDILTDLTGIDGFTTTWENIALEGTRDIALAFRSEQIKDSSPVTYDDDGNVIPLSQRFNMQNPDIRYSISDFVEDESEIGVGVEQTSDNSITIRYSIPTEINAHIKGDGRVTTVRLMRDGFMKGRGKERKAVNTFIDALGEHMVRANDLYKCISLSDVQNATVTYRKDADGNPTSVIMSCQVQNGEYEINYDFSTICKKRKAFQDLIETFFRKTDMDTLDLTEENIFKINEILESYGFEIACPICFVEARRYANQEYADKIVNTWNAEVEKINPDAEYFDFANADPSTFDYVAIDEALKKVKIKEGMDFADKCRELVKSGAVFQKKMQQSDILTNNGVAGMKAMSNEDKNLFGYMKGSRGASAPKEIVAFNAYNGEIEALKDTYNNMPLEDFLYSIGGARLQSFSDFQIENVYDYIQLIAGLAARKLPAHAYTKEVAFARLFGMTGMKINLSLVCDVDPNVDDEHAGLKQDEDGNWVYNLGSQSFDIEEARKLQNDPNYSKNVGTIMVGLSDAHIWMALDDSDVRYIIPYHKSGLPNVIQKVTHLAKAEDYTKYQNTCQISATGLKKLEKAGYETDVKAIFEKNNKNVKKTLDEINKNFEKVKFTSNDVRKASKLVPKQGSKTGEMVEKKLASTGDFNVYDDVAKTKNPRKTAENYCAYCFENGYIPLFFEFAGHKNYYKMIFDFNVYDCVSERYAPQGAVKNIYPGVDLTKGETDYSGMFNAEGWQEGKANGLIDEYMHERDEFHKRQDPKLKDVITEVKENVLTDLQLKEEEDETRWSLSDTAKDMDARYMDYVNEGNMEEAQKLVEQAAKMAGYNSPKVYHGSPVEEAFTTFVPNAFLTEEGGDNQIKGYFSEDRSYSENYGAVREFYVRINHPFEINNEEKDKTIKEWVKWFASKGVPDVKLDSSIEKDSLKGADYGDGRRVFGMWEIFDSGAYWNGDGNLTTKIKEAGFDGIKWDFGEKAWIPFDDTAIKSADTVTYAEDGSIIPLSERFNPESNDIRYSLPTQDSEDTILSDGQMEYFKNSAARNNEGKLVPVYHTTRKGGFSVFDPSRSDDRRSLFFSSSLDVSQTYSRNAEDRFYMQGHNISTMDDVRDYLDAYGPDVFILSEEQFKDAGGNDAGLFDLWDAQEDRFKELRDREDLLDTYINEAEQDGYLIFVGMPNYTGDPSFGARWTMAESSKELPRAIRDDFNWQSDNYEKESGYYECYLNLENPLIVDARGANWNQIDAAFAIPGLAKLEDDSLMRITKILVFPQAADKSRIRVFVGGQKKINGYWQKLSEEGMFDLNNDSPFGIPNEFIKELLSKSDGNNGIMEPEEDGHYNAIYLNDSGILDPADYGIDEANSEYQMYLSYGDYAFETTFNTREIAEHADLNGYDGVIIKNCRDLGGKALFEGDNEISDIYIAFSSNQVKDTANMNPTENPDIRFSITPEDETVSRMAYEAAEDDSIEILEYYEQRLANLTDEEAENIAIRDYDEDDAALFYSALRSEEPVPYEDYVLEEDRIRIAKSKNDFFSNVNAKWNDRWTTEPGGVLDVKSVKTDVRNLIMGVMQNSDTDSKYKRTLVNKTLMDVRYAYEFFKKDRPELASALLYHSAQRMIDNVQFYVDGTFDQYKELKHYLRNTKISIGEEYWSDVEYDSFRKRNYNRINLVKGKTNVDQVYQELEELFPEFFDSEETMDVPSQLLQMEYVLDSVQPYKEAYSSEAAAELAFDIADDLYEIMVNGDEVRSLADTYKARYDAKTKAMKQRHAEAMLRVRKARDEGIAKEKQKFREYKEKQKEKKLHTKHFDRINKNYKWLKERLLTNTKDKHIPEQYKKELAGLLAAFDLQTIRSKKIEAKRGYQSQKTIQMSALRTGFEAMHEAYPTFFIHDAIMDKMKELAKKVDGKTIDALDVEQIAEIDDILKGIKSDFINYDKIFVKGKQMAAADPGKAQAKIALEHAEKFGPGTDYQNAPGAIDKIINLEEMTAPYLFRRIDPNKEGLGMMYGEIRRAFDKYVRNQNELNGWMDEIVGKYHQKGILWNKYGSGELANWRSENYAVTFDFEGGSATLTPAQMMSIYCLSKRSQAQKHMYSDVGGIVVAPVSFNAKLLSDVKKKANKALPVRLTESDVQQIVAKLTPEQIQVAEQLQELMSTKMAEWGNEASMDVMGIELFKEDNYFPIKSDKASLTQELNDDQFVQAIRNFGFAKALMPEANNPIMVEDIFDVVTEHCNNMNLYNAYSKAFDDFMKVYNYKDYGDGGSNYTVQQAVAHAYSQKATTFIMTFLRDLNGNVSGRASGIEDAYNSLLGNAKKAAVFANLRVAAQQPTAITRAFAVISPKYLKGIKIEKGAMDEMFEHCPIALWKSWGYYDINMGKSIEDIMMNNGKWLEDKATDLYGALDNVTWLAIWQMVKAEMKDTHPNVKIGSDEYWELCNERMSEVVDLTQVVDSPLHRSHAMRSKNFLVKTATAFMAEPTLTFNMIRDGWIRAREAKKLGNHAEASKIIGRTIAVALLQAATVAGAAGLIDALRKKHPDKDDEDERILHLWLVNFVENLKDELKLWNKVYFVKDIASIMEGWDDRNLALQGIQKFSLGWRQLKGDPYARSSATWYENLGDGLGYMFGVPVKTMRTGIKNAMDMFGVTSPIIDATKERLDSIADNAKDRDPKSTIVGMLASDEIKVEGNGVFGKLLAKADESDKKSDKKSKGKGKSKTATKMTHDEERDALRDLEAKARENAEGLSGSELDDALWDTLSEGYTKHLEAGDLDYIEHLALIYRNCGGDENIFREKIKAKIGSAYKKTFKDNPTDEDLYAQDRMRHFMEERLGMTEEEVSAIVYKTDAARDLKVAFRINNEEYINNEIAILARAGITYDDVEKLYKNRNRMKLETYNGKYKDMLKSTGKYLFPADGIITSDFGNRNSPGGIGSTNHQGLDIAGAKGTPIQAADGGVVIMAGWYGGYGKTVQIQHDDGTVTQYSHLDWWDVNEGDTVAQGQEVGLMGSTGNSTGPHLHFGVLKNGEYVDPKEYINTNDREWNLNA